LTDGDVTLPSNDAEGAFEVSLNTSKSIKSSLGFDVLQQHKTSYFDPNQSYLKDYYFSCGHMTNNSWLTR